MLIFLQASKANDLSRLQELTQKVCQVDLFSLILKYIMTLFAEVNRSFYIFMLYVLYSTLNTKKLSLKIVWRRRKPGDRLNKKLMR